MKKFFKIKTGFTLAEVLITLLIIGVVASIIIPNLLNDTQNAELKTSWKKAYAEMAQATAKIILDNGGTFKNSCSTANAMCLRNLYTQHLSYVKLCDTDKFLGNCWSSDTWQLNGQTLSWSGDAGAVLNNGTFLLFYNLDVTCSSPSNQILRCGAISVDVNGFKGPNVLGKDIYRMWILQNSVLPYGTQWDDRGGRCSSTTSGESCAAQYLYQ